MSERLVDIHTHLLPGVDDGCRSMRETLQHLERFSRQGVTSVVLTPHLMIGPRIEPADIDLILWSQLRSFDAVLRRTGLLERAPELVLGQELRLRSGRDAALVATHPRVGFGGRDVVLVEFGFHDGYDADAVLDVLSAAGRTVVIAHPERYAFDSVEDGVRAAARWKAKGALLQINGGSLLGLYTLGAEQLARRLVAEGLVDIAATDHHGDARPHDPAVLFGALGNGLGLQRADELMEHAPARLLRGVPAGRAAAGGLNAPDLAVPPSVLYGHWTKTPVNTESLEAGGSRTN